MSKIAFVGHKESRYTDKNLLERNIDDILHVLQRQHKDELLLLLNGDIGAAQRVGKQAIVLGIKYKLYLPYPIECLEKLWNINQMIWTEQQNTDFIDIVTNRLCNGIYSVNDIYDEENFTICNKKMIDECNYLFVLWIGKKIGKTYECIKYALEKGKQVFNAYGNSIHQLANEDLDE